jgi:uncharacterized membrane protein YbhN (UPF0104 family)
VPDRLPAVFKDAGFVRRVLPKLLISAFLLAALFWLADGKRLAAHVGDISAAGWMGGLLLLTLQIVVVTVRWRILLDGLKQRVPMWRLTEIQVLGVLANSFLISGLGGLAVRAALLYRQGVGLPAVGASMAVERILPLVVLSILAIASLPILMAIEAVELRFIGDIVLVLALALGLAILLIATNEWGGRMRMRIARMIETTLRDIRTVLRDGRTVTLALAATVVAQGLFFVAVIVLGRDLGITVPLLDFLALLPVVALFASLPISIGGWGAREGAMVFGLTLLGVPLEQALVLSVMVGLLSVLAVVPVGLLTLAARLAAPEGRSAGRN